LVEKESLRCDRARLLGGHGGVSVGIHGDDITLSMERVVVGETSKKLFLRDLERASCDGWRQQIRKMWGLMVGTTHNKTKVCKDSGRCSCVLVQW